MFTNAPNKWKAAKWVGPPAAVGLVLLMTVALQPRAWGDEQQHGHSGGKEPAKSKVLLDVGLYLADGSTTAAFVLTNQGTEEFRTTPVFTNYNRLVIESPDGEISEYFVWKDGIPPVVVSPSGSQTWNIDLSRYPAFEKRGLYRVHWKVGQLESAEFVIVRE